MAEFHYVAILPNGSRRSGSASAATQAELAARLQKQRAYPVRIRPKLAVRLGWPDRLPHPGAGRALLVVTGELRTLLGAGMTVDRALSIVASRTTHGSLQQTLKEVRDAVRKGQNFGEAIAAEPKVFSPVYVALVRAGEASGRLPDTLSRLHSYMVRRDAIKHSLTSALIYPCILLVAACMALLLLSEVVLPEFLPMFAQAGAHLPLLTQIVVSVSWLITHCWPIVVVGVPVAVWLCQRWLANLTVRRRVHGQILKFPVLGSLWRSIEAARFARTAGTLMLADTPVPVALALALEVLTNAAMRQGALEALTAVREGSSLSEAIARTSVFPALSVQLLAVGEETGRIESMLIEQADLLDEATQRRIGLLLALLVPALTVGVGLIVGSVLGAVMLAVLKLNELAG
jgi:general secretion pathway protein F